MKNPLISLTLVIVLYSCSSDPGTEFPVTENCTTRKLTSELMLVVPGNLIAMDSLLIVLDPFATDFALKAYDQFSGEYLFSGARVGNGPLEVSTPFNLYESQGVHLFDVGKQKVVCYVLNPRKKEFEAVSEHFLPSSEYYSDANHLEGDHFIISPPKEEGIVSFIDLSDNRELPIVKNPLKKVDDEIIRNELVGSFKFDVSREYMVFAANNTPYVALYRKKDEGYEIVFDTFISEPVYHISDGDLMWDGEKNVVGIMDVAIGQGRIFLLHSNLKSGMPRGRSIEAIPKIMYEFDYQGNPLKKYNLDIPVLRITMDPAGRLYGIAMDEQVGDFKIVRLMI